VHRGGCVAERASGEGEDQIVEDGGEVFVLGVEFVESACVVRRAG
jgi:hypothetical protein